MNSQEIEELLKVSKYEDDFRSIDFTLSPSVLNTVEESVEVDVYTSMVTVKDKLKGSQLTFPVELVKIPTLTPMGYKINSSYKQVVSAYVLSKGYYLDEDKHGAKSLVVKSERGFNVSVGIKNNELIIQKKGVTSSKMKLSIFLKAVTKMSYSQLSILLGPENLPVLMSFNVGDEPHYIDCLRMTLSKLLNSRTGRERQVAKMSVRELESELYDRLYDLRFVDLGSSTMTRLITTTSFKERAKGLILEEDINLNGYSYKKGQTLHIKDLEELDFLPVSSLKVSSLDRKHFTIRKTYSNNFRVLGRTLVQGINVKDKVIPAGTKLTVPLLHQIENTMIRYLIVDANNESGVERITRSTSGRHFDWKDFVSALQTYMDFFNGICSAHQTSSLSNQNIENMGYRAINVIKQNCQAVVVAMTSPTNPEDDDLLIRAVEKLKVSTDDLVHYLRNSEVKEVQASETNNTIQKISKDYRISKDVPRSTPSMTEIANDQASLVDGFDTPESSKVGLTQSRTWVSIINSDGVGEAPFTVVENGKPTDTVVYLTASQYKGSPIAEWNETFTYFDSDGIEKPSKFVQCYMDGEIITANIEDVKYMFYGPYALMSPAHACIFGSEHEAAKRITMGANHIKSSHILMKGQPPRVSSGGASLIRDGIYTVERIIKESQTDNVKLQALNPEMLPNIKLVLEGKHIIPEGLTLRLRVLGVSSDPIYLDYTVVYGVKSGTGGLYSSRIKYKPNMTYSWEDIVAVTTDYHSFESLDELELMVDTGTMKMDHNDFKETLSLGTNLLVAVKTGGSCTIDDSVIISRKLIGDDTLSSIALDSCIYELKDPSRDEKSNQEEIEHFIPLTWSRGPLPPEGEYVSPGDELLRVSRKKVNILNGDEVHSEPHSIHYEGIEDAQILSSRIEGNKAIIILGRINSIEQGDKLSGSHGDKSVIAKIVEEHEMPYIAETGQATMMYVNGLSLPARMNVAIIVEGTFGMAGRLNNKNYVITPFKEGVFDTAQKLIEENNIKPQHLVDGMTGIPFDRPVNVLEIYYYKSEHAVDKKIKYVDENVPRDPKFGQGSRGTGTQAHGEYETWVMESLGAVNMLQALYSYKSVDTRTYLNMKDKINSGEPLEKLEGNNPNDKYIQIMLRVCGIDPKVDSSGNMVMRPLTDEMIRSLNAYNVPDGADDKLRSEIIFGNPKVSSRVATWSWFELGTEIVNPAILVYGQLHKFLRIRRMLLEEDKEGTIKVTVKDPLTASFEILSNLILCNKTEALTLLCTEDGDRVVVPTLDIKKYKEYVAQNKVIKKDNLGPLLASSKEYIGMAAVVHLFKTCDPQEALDAVSSDPTSKPEEVRKMKFLVSSFLKSGVKLSDYVTSTFPVMPIFFRPESRQRGVQQEYDYYYRRIMEVATRIINNPVTPDLSRELTERITDLIGINLRGQTVSTNIRESYKPLMEFFSTATTNKKGASREKILKTRIVNSGRTPIIPSNSLHRLPTEMGIPFIMATSMWKTQLIKELSTVYSSWEIPKASWEALLEVMGISEVSFKKVHGRLRFSGNPVPLEDFYEMVYLTIKNYVEGPNRFSELEDLDEFCVITSGRQPTLHRYSIGAFRPYLVNHKCIEINPLLCSGYNADFDGDQMWAMAWFTRAEKKEALDIFSPLQSTLNPKDGSVVLQPKQDIVLGTYYLTMFMDNVASFDSEYYENIDLKYYHNLESLESDLELKLLMPQDPIIFVHKGKMYPATAGRILMNGLIPHFLAFTDKPYEDHSNFPCADTVKKRSYSLMFDGVLASPKGKVSKRSMKISKLESMNKFVIANCSKEEYIQYIQDVSRIGFYYSDRSGVTISLLDFKQRERTQEIIRNADVISRSLDKSYRIGTLTAEDRKTMRIDLYSRTKAAVMKDYLTNIDRNSNIYIMFESGARGDEGQITQAAVMVGVLQKNSRETLEYPVRNSFIRGLSSFEMLLTLYSARQANVATQLETANAGELTRLAVSVLEGIEIVEPDCGAGYTEVPLLLEEFDYIRKVNDDGSTESISDFSSILGKYLQGPDLARKVLKNSMEGGRLSNKDILLLIKNKIQFLHLHDGVYQIKYKLNPLFDSLYYYRNAIDLPHLLKGKYISEKTLEYVNELQPEKIKVRDIFRCKSVGGVCQACYGAQYDTLEEPPLGMGVPIMSGQAIGEPSTQLTMNTHNRGGAAGGSINAGVKFVGNLINFGRVYKSSYLGPHVAPYSGYINLNSDGGLLLVKDLELENEIPLPYHNSQFQNTDLGLVILNIENPLVGYGEYVRQGQLLSDGLPQSLYGISQKNNEILYINQMRLLEILHGVYSSSGINIYARHFEILVRAMTQLITITESDHPDLLPGQVIDKSVVEKAIGEGYEISYENKVSSANEISLHFAGPIASLLLKDVRKTIGPMITSQFKYPNRSPISKIGMGQSLTNPVIKGFREIQLITRKENKVKAVEENINYAELVTVTAKEVRSQSTDLEIMDLDDLYSSFTTEEVSQDIPLETKVTKPVEELPLDNNKEKEYPVTDTKSSAFN